MATKVWTTSRKWIGNIIPALFWFPPVVYGIGLVIKERAVTPAAVGWVLGGNVIGWLALSTFGFYGNRWMRKTLEPTVKDKGDRWFVGFASPKYTGLLDAHEDVGFLVLGPKALVFVGESRRVELERDAVVQVRYRMNAHSAVGLGRWVCVEGVVKGQPVRLLVESREKSTMLGNLFYSGKLRAAIEAWIKAS